MAVLNFVKREVDINVDNKCYLCKNSDVVERPGKVRDNSDLKVLECRSCGLVFLSSFDHIGKDFYKLSGMHSEEIDLDAWLIETDSDDERRFNFLRNNVENKSVMDFGCGNAGFLMRSRKIARSVVGIEPELRFSDHFKKEGVNVVSDMDKLDAGNFDIITMFHVVEHLQDPIEVLQKIGKRLNKDGQLIIETPNSNDALLSVYKSSAFSSFTYWSCHLFLYNQETLSALVRKAGMKLNYIKQVQRYPLSNHLYWLAKGKPGGHKSYSFINSERLSKEYEAQLASIGACDTVIVSCSND